MICIELADGSLRRIEHEIYVRRQENGAIVRCHKVHRQGVCDGEQTWSLGSLEGYPRAKVITLAEYLERPEPPSDDPELTAEEALGIILGGNV